MIYILEPNVFSTNQGFLKRKSRENKIYRYKKLALLPIGWFGEHGGAGEGELESVHLEAECAALLGKYPEKLANKKWLT